MGDGDNDNASMAAFDHRRPGLWRLCRLERNPQKHSRGAIANFINRAFDRVSLRTSSIARLTGSPCAAKFRSDTRLSQLPRLPRTGPKQHAGGHSSSTGMRVDKGALDSTGDQT